MGALVSPNLSSYLQLAKLCFDSLLRDATDYNWLKRVAGDPVDVKKLTLLLVSDLDELVGQSKIFDDLVLQNIV